MELGRSFCSVFKYEIRRTLSKKSFLFSMFGLPVLGLVLVAFLRSTINTGDITQRLMEFAVDTGGIKDAGYVDYSGLFPQAGQLAGEYLTRYEDEAQARAALDAGEITVYYIIPADYAETGEVQSVLPSFSMSSISSAPMRLLFFSQVGEQLQNVEDLNVLGVPPTFQVNKLQTERESRLVNEDNNNSAVTIFAILFVFALFGTNGYLMQTVIEEKETRLIEILLSSLTPLALLTGKILALGLLGLLQLVIYVGALLIGVGLYGGDLSFLSAINLSAGTIIILVIYFVLGYLLFAGAFGAVGAISSSITEGPALATIFILPAIIPLVISGTFAQDPNGGIAVFMSLFPLTSPMAMIMRTSITDVPVTELILSIGILAVTVVGMMWLAARLFRQHTLLAGAGFKLRDIPRLIFGNE